MLKGFFRQAVFNLLLATMLMVGCGSQQPALGAVGALKVSGIEAPNIIHRVSTLSDLNFDGTPGRRMVYLGGRSAVGDGGEGIFVWLVGDYSAHVAADTFSGVYKAGASAPTVGVWKRQVDEPADPRWYGAASSANSGSFIQAAINNSKSIVIREGDFYVENSVTIPTGRTITIERGTTVLAADTLTGAIFKNIDQAAGNSDIVIKGGGIIDGRNIATEGLDFRLVTKLDLSGFTVKNCTKYGVYTYKIGNSQIVGISATLNGSASHFNYSGIGLNGYEIRVLNCELFSNQGNGLRYWHDSAANTARLTFIGNVFRDNSQHGILGNPEGTVVPMSQIILNGNKAHGNGGGVMYSGFAMHYSSQVSAVGNLGYNNAEHGYVAMDGANHALSGNVWRANGLAGVRIQGDFVRPEDSGTGAYSVAITGDQFVGNGVSGTGPASLKGGVVISGRCRDISVLNSSFTNNANIAVRSNSVASYTDSWNIYVYDSVLNSDKLYNGTAEKRFYYDNIRRDGGFYHPLKAADGILSKSRGQDLWIMNRTSDYALDSSESGLRIANAGAGSAVTITLPPATQGQTFSFSRTTSGQELRVDPAGSENIKGGGAGKYLIVAAGGSATLMCINAGTWEIVASYGTHTYEP